MSEETRWGVCATVKAPTDEVLKFAAHYLDAGAHRVWIYLDEDAPETRDALDGHPKCQAIECSDAYWHRIFGRRPTRHQVRQTQNATRTYQRAGEVDWLLSVDVDEFLVSPRPVADVLAALTGKTLTARVRPMEALAVQSPHYGPQAFKRFIPAGPQRVQTVEWLYPTYGRYLKGGFLSHVAGKNFVRTGAGDMQIRIHNVCLGEQLNPGSIELGTMALAHLHAPDWEQWSDKLPNRLARGAYRAEISPAVKEGPTLNALLSDLSRTKDDTALKHFFKEVCEDGGDLRTRLSAQGLLALHDLRLDAKRHHYFPERHATASIV